MVSPIETIVSFLELQDDQGNDWYGWASNQLSHAFLGVFFSGLVLVLGGAWYYAIGLLVVLGVAKKLADWSKQILTWKVVRDTIQDLLFFINGGVFSLSILYGSIVLFVYATISVSSLLVSGIVARIVQSKREKAND
ncbi:MAG: hypothetical protein IM607_12320 [Cytophagales bacterium]|nr:hypothetical protein [Cytophagales bacterium]